MSLKHIFGLVLLCMGLVVRGFGQGAAPAALALVPLDSVQLKTVKGTMVGFGSLMRQHPVILLCFWSSNNDASVAELNAINAQYEGWKQQADFTMVAICVDQGTLVNRMRPMVNQNGWTFEVYADVSEELQRGLGYAAAPQTMVLNKGQVVFQQSGYAAGSEKYLWDKVRGLAGKAARK